MRNNSIYRISFYPPYLLVFFWRMIPRWLWERLPIKN